MLGGPHIELGLSEGHHLSLLIVVGLGVWLLIQHGGSGQPKHSRSLARCGSLHTGRHWVLGLEWAKPKSACSTSLHHWLTDQWSYGGLLPSSSLLQRTSRITAQSNTFHSPSHVSAFVLESHSSSIRILAMTFGDRGLGRSLFIILSLTQNHHCTIYSVMGLHVC